MSASSYPHSGTGQAAHVPPQSSVAWPSALSRGLWQHPHSRDVPHPDPAMSPGQALPCPLLFPWGQGHRARFQTKAVSAGLCCGCPSVPCPRPNALSSPESATLTRLLQVCLAAVNARFRPTEAAPCPLCSASSASPRCCVPPARMPQLLQRAPSCEPRPGLAGPSCLGWAATGLTCIVVPLSGEGVSPALLLTLQKRGFGSQWVTLGHWCGISTAAQPPHGPHTSDLWVQSISLSL